MKAAFFLILCFLNIQGIYSQIDLNFAKKNTFKINVYSESHLIKTGSGFILKSFQNGGKNVSIGISNAHVIDGGDSITLEFSDEKYSLTTFDFIDVEKDLISFHFETKNYKKGYSSTIKFTYQQGEVVYTMSNPRGLDYSLSKGEIASIRQDYDNEYLQFTAPASPGSSGSPLLSSKGELLGVISKQVTSGQNLNFALSTRSTKSFFSVYNEYPFAKNPPSKLIKRIFYYKSESSPILKMLQDKIGGSKPTIESYELLEKNKRYVVLDNYLLMMKITMEIGDFSLYRNALQSFIAYNNNFGFSSQLIALNYLSAIYHIKDDKLMVDYLTFNEELQTKYPMEPFFIYTASVLNFKLNDYYSAISNALKFTKFRSEFDTENNLSPFKYSNTLNKQNIASAFGTIAISYDNLENYNLAEEYYQKAIKASNLIGEWCRYSTLLISLYQKLKDDTKLCSFVKFIEKDPNISKCEINEKVLKNIKRYCELVDQKNEE